ncbi:MAG: hypothetical protein KGM94_23840, partial [Bradyrhizobium sp.]|nr:hypothetical protein [Bradyrhizobium sp.]
IAIENVLQMAAVMALGAVALWWFGPAGRDLRAVYLGAILLYLLGVVVPAVSTSPMILNLQLLRSGAMIHLLASLAIAALATTWLRRESAALFLPGCAVVLALYLGGVAFLIVIPLILASARFEAAGEFAPAYRRKLGYAMLAASAFALFPASVWETYTFNRLYSDAATQWAAVGHWARAATPPTAIFIVPPRPRIDAQPAPPASEVALSRAGIFEFVSHRRVWVDYKRGAAAMWTPSYYRVWHERMTEMADLNDHAARLAYASRKGIDYVVELCETLPSQDDVLFRTEHLCVSAVKRLRG